MRCGPHPSTPASWGVPVGQHLLSTCATKTESESPLPSPVPPRPPPRPARWERSFSSPRGPRLPLHGGRRTQNAACPSGGRGSGARVGPSPAAARSELCLPVLVCKAHPSRLPSHGPVSTRQGPGDAWHTAVPTMFPVVASGDLPILPAAAPSPSLKVPAPGLRVGSNCQP